MSETEAYTRPGRLEKLMAVLAPKRAAAMAQLRLAHWMMDQHMSRYKAGDVNRLNADWITDNKDINAHLRTKLTRMRSRSRALIRDNPYGSSAINNMLNYIVGTGMSLQMAVRRWEYQDEDGKQVLVPVELEAWNDWVEDLFGLWAENCDVTGSETFPVHFIDAQRLTLRKWFEDGEAFIHLVEDWTLPGHPLRLQFIEPESLDLTKTEHNGNPVIMGVEVDKRTGRKLAYWVYEETDKTGFAVTLTSRRIDARNMIHVYTVLRPGQLRGVPWMAAVIQRFWDLDEYADAELIGNKIAACFSVFITTPQGTEIPLLKGATDSFPKDANGNAIQNIAPGIIGAGLPAGSDVNVVSPQKPGATFGMFTKHHLTAMAAGVEHGMSYYALTRDTSGTTFAGGRQAQLMDYQGYRPIQGALARKFCRPVLRRWMDAAVQLGTVSAPGYFDQAPGREFWLKHEWMPPGWTWGINPLQEVKASEASMRCGITSHDDECAMLGYDGKTQRRKIARERREMRRLGIMLDSDPANDKGRTAPEANDSPPAGDDDTKEEGDV